MYRKRLVLAGVVAALASGWTVSTADAQSTNWQFFTYFPANDKPAQLNREFAADVTEATDGRLSITVFAAGELPYRAPDVLKAVAGNQVQMGDVALGFASGDVPQLNVLSMPFLCTSYEEFEAAIGIVAPEVEQDLADRFGVDVAIHWTMPPQNLWLNREIDALDDISGLKVRTWNPEQVEMIQLLGGSPVSITSAEVIPALERQVIDGAITSALSANDWRAYETLKTGYMANFTMGHQVMMVNAEALAALPDDVREIFLEKAEEWTPKYLEMAREGDEAARQNLVANGVTLIEPDADEIARARERMQPLWTEWASEHGSTAQTLLEKTREACVSG